MNWIKPPANEPQTYITSECGRFRINGAGKPPVYQAVRLLPPPKVILLGRGTLAECKRACGEAA